MVQQGKRKYLCLGQCLGRKIFVPKVQWDLGHLQEKKGEHRNPAPQHRILVSSISNLEPELKGRSFLQVREKVLLYVVVEQTIRLLTIVLSIYELPWENSLAMLEVLIWVQQILVLDVQVI